MAWKNQVNKSYDIQKNHDMLLMKHVEINSLVPGKFE